MSQSRGSFEPEDYFNLTPPCDLSIQSPSNEGSTMALEEHIKRNHNHLANCPNYLQPKK